MTYKSLPSQAYLRECFDYDPETGALRWKVRPLEHFIDRRVWKLSNSNYAGRFITSIGSHGYHQVRVNGVDQLAHRVVWKWMTGEDPPNQIDHIDGVRSDNRWENLRLATISQNRCNRGFSRNNKLGIKGVHPHRHRFAAEIRINNVVIYLGHFPTAAAAKIAYDESAQLYHGAFWHP